MKEMYQNQNDCFELEEKLKTRMESSIEFYGNPSKENVMGKYFSRYKKSLFAKGLPFSYKFSKDQFLTIQVGSFDTHKNSTGEKLAALSEFYQVLRKEYGEPNIFYTIKNDPKENLSLHWSFANKEEDLQKLKIGTFLDNGVMDQVIILENSHSKRPFCNNDTTRESLATIIGLPITLTELVEENIDDFILYKTGKQLSYPSNGYIDMMPITTIDSYEKRLCLKPNNKVRK